MKIRRLLAILALLPVSHLSAAEETVPAILDFETRTIDGKEILLSRYKGKVLLVVNTASQCGQTPQYAALQRLHEKFGKEGLQVVAFPSNDFGEQEPGTNAEIARFCSDKYGVTFDVMSKIAVKGEMQHPLYTFLTARETNPRHSGPIRWNFEKFLIGRDGTILKRFASSVEPEDQEVVGAIREALNPPAKTSTGTESKGPPGVDVYMGRTVAQTMHWRGASWLLRRTREREEATSEMIREIGLKPGMTVADIGVGNGYHTGMMARMIGDTGKVLATDIQQEMLDMLELRMGKMGIHNVVPILGEFWDAKLPANSVDFALMVDVYHEFSHPEQMLAGIRKALKPSGQIVLVEFRTEDPDVPIKKLHKMSKDQILKEYVANGFKLTRSYDKLPWQHMMFFGRDVTWKKP